MQAIVLVGGEGTRLRPLTYSRPKALVPFLGRPFLHGFIKHLSAHGFDDVIIAASHGKEAIAASVGDGSALGVRVRYADEPLPLGSAGAIRNVAELLTGATFLVANGDILSDFDLSAMLALHRETAAIVTIALTPVEDTSGFGVVDIDSEHRIGRFVEKPPREEAPSNWINAGFWLFEPKAVDFIPDGQSMVETRLFPDLIAAGERLSGYRSSAYWMDLGTPQRYLLAHRERLQAAGGVEAAEAVVEHGADVVAPAVIGRAALVRSGARIEGPACIGDACDIAAGAEIADSVLWERVRVEHGASVRGSILAEDVVVGAGACVEDAVVGAGACIEAGKRTPHGLRLDPGERYPVEPSE